jgi:small multidrug resistance pump
MSTIILLFGAILSEVIATTALKFSEGFTRLIPSVIVVVGYSAAFYLLSLSLRTISIGVAYAIWSGVGIVLTVVAGLFIWHERLDAARIIGIALIIGGVLIINLFSKTAMH